MAALTAQEKQLAKATFHQGPEALLNLGWTVEAAAAFSERPEVKEYWVRLKREYDIHEGLRGRSKFTALRNLHQMIDPASAVLMQSLAGPEYLRDPRTNAIMRDANGRPMVVIAEPTQRQQKAAEFVLLSVGVRDHRLVGDSASDPSLKLLFSTEDDALTLEDDPLLETEEARAQSRERIRNVMLRLSGRVRDVHAKVRTGLGLDDAPKARGKRKRRKGRRGGTKG